MPINMVTMPRGGRSSMTTDGGKTMFKRIEHMLILFSWDFTNYQLFLERYYCVQNHDTVTAVFVGDSANKYLFSFFFYLFNRTPGRELGFPITASLGTSFINENHNTISCNKQIFNLITYGGL